MSGKRNYSLTVVSDEKTEQFSVSKCDCDKCKSMHLSQIEWDIFKPKTQLQKRMKKVISKIEKRNSYSSSSS
jgi:hypothetical protein